MSQGDRGIRLFQWRGAIMVAAAAGLAALGGGGWFVYGAVQKAGARSALERARQEAPHDLNEAAARLAERLKTEPTDADGWRLLMRTYVLLGDQAKAADASRHLQALGGVPPAGPEAKSSLGEDLVAANGGIVSPEAKKLFEEAQAADPNDPRARFFLGLAAAQNGRLEGALGAWLKLEADSPPGAPWLDGLGANIARLAEEMGLSKDRLAERRAAMTPTRTEVATAARPAASPVPAAAEANPQYWSNLGASYAQNGDHERALSAFRQASILAQPGGAPNTPPSAPMAAPNLLQGAKPLANPGPSGSDIAAAARMTPDERMAMINSMVQRLADRLAQNPGDVDGWLRLARAYKVLGDREKAVDALSNAVRADPNRADVRRQYDEARTQSGQTMGAGQPMSGKP